MMIAATTNHRNNPETDACMLINRLCRFDQLSELLHATGVSVKPHGGNPHPHPQRQQALSQSDF
jgi:hypothetical protein